MTKDIFEIRPILPSDKTGMQEGISQLSNESRRQRFFASRKNLTEKELSFFTEVDQINHLAFVAIFYQDGHPTPAGSIRCIRSNTKPDYAELAVTIIDRFQGQGLGLELMDTLAQAALTQKITHFYGDFQANNTRMLKLLEKYCVKHKISKDSLLLKHKSGSFLYFEMALA